MIRLGLMRRREVWFPTWRGWTVLATSVVAVAALVIANVHSFLAVSAPVGATTLVVEGWLGPEELEQAVATFRSGGYEQVVTTGGPIEGWAELIGHRNFADLAADYLTRHGLPRSSVVAVPAPASAQDRTYLSAVTVREWAAQAAPSLRSLDVFSGGTHARRTWLMYRLAFGPDFDVGIRATADAGPGDPPWWRTSAGVKDVVIESFGFLWAKAFFRPPAPGSHEERWAVPAPSPRPVDSR